MNEVIKNPRDPSHGLSFYGRRSGRSLKGEKKDLYATLLPKVTINLQDAPAFFQTHASRKLVLEMGFGHGEHLANHAFCKPDTLFMGIEIFRNGIAALLKEIDQKKLKNIFIYPDDGRAFFPHIPPRVFQDIYVLFPDPWPKKRHRQRRLLTLKTMAQMATWLQPSGRLVMATDHEDYGEMIQENVANLEGGVATQIPWETRQEFFPHWVMTKYAKKAQSEGRTPRCFIWQKSQS